MPAFRVRLSRVAAALTRTSGGIDRFPGRREDRAEPREPDTLPPESGDEGHGTDGKGPKPAIHGLRSSRTYQHVTDAFDLLMGY